MHKLFKTGHGILYPILLRNPKFLTPISQFHISSETLAPNRKLEFVVNEVQQLRSSNPSNEFVSASDTDEPSGPANEEGFAVQISHPWREWVDLMELLLKRGYFEGDENPFRNGEVGPKESNRIRTACLNFARDRSSLLRLLSRKDVQIIAGYGCPSIDRKVVNSGKRLRAHVGVDEGDVCSSCGLRGDCERAYVKAREDEGGRTVDVMRFLLTHGLDPLTDTVGNKPSLNKKVKESVRRLLKEMVEYSTDKLDTDLPTNMTLKGVKPSPKHAMPQEKHNINVPMKQGDWICPKCNFLNFARNVKCLRCDGLFQERLAKLREDQDHLPLKKGDWICEKCNFLNFAKNSRCLQCKEKPPKRELNPGEWECDSCNYINFRKNMLCLKCDHKRPKTSAEPRHEDGGYHNSNSVSFGDTNVNDRSYSGQGRNGQNRGAGRWRFVVEENDDHSQSNSLDKTSRFVDFPIAGGKTELSQNPQKRNRWKLKMLEKSKGGTMDMASDDELGSTSNERRVLFSDSTDDEEMAAWFGDRKLETQRLPSRPN
ncbi:putative Zinc finger, RanBP2-type [Rosa chinensis]|uniref:Putative Zinc finger, RanBP2-type n=1 Tax=Rosa chinensis TaxID=74649 RepID=A0A2P6R3R6_ROSCH|nr:zinc finger protein VAR3, chloroplastic [Rosa chinensis]PRQ41095.1 putative Zinc finger, RanBP2-type [Rosa chinensis]